MADAAQTAQLLMWLRVLSCIVLFDHTLQIGKPKNTISTIARTEYPFLPIPLQSHVVLQ